MKKAMMFGDFADDFFEKKYGCYADDGSDGAGAGGDDGDGGDGDAGDAGDGGAADAGKKKTSSAGSLLAGEEGDVLDKGGKQELNLLAGKFKTPAELEEGYKALSKKLTESGKLAPEKYELKLPEGVSLSDPDNDPQLKGFLEVAKKYNLSNEAVSDIVALKLGFDSEAVPDYEEEVEKLGTKGPELIKGLSQFLMARLDADEFKSISQFAVTAENIKILDKLRKSASGVKIPGSGGDQQSGRATPEAAEEALAKAREAEAKGSPDAERLRKEAQIKFAEAYPE